MKVIGAGLGRTGTYSLKLALEQLLEGKCYHMAEVFERQDHLPLWTRAAEGEATDWEAMFDGYVAGVDWPVCTFAVELAQVYPDALILLSTRDFDSWWKSASSTIFNGIGSADGAWGEMIRALFGNTFTLQLEDEAACKAAFEAHYREMRDALPADRLLEWQATEGWDPICKRLGLPVPTDPFPHRNTTEDFLRRRQ